MFDVGFSELILLAVIALVVLGPEKLPHAARMTGAWLGRIRRAVTSIQIEIEKEVAAAELKERMNKEIERLKSHTEPITQELSDLENSISSNHHAARSESTLIPAETLADIAKQDYVEVPPVQQELLLSAPVTDDTPSPKVNLDKAQRHE
ncbi:Sec-independent protein translocase protein TatB [Agitococcus lubricus]|uniref:Sec-independent protein translocase protein TatB n=1 Tax=Agitococcus lubricus TaxID=1077255 RepID=A0A2T5IUX8_9GAMM|nr:Sec-independent protein translocase protein TatB [Agitococcus lubricus]PTQ87692.1 sec-independent protein translocase protein TatB [Agitococcus lubricus]